MNRNKINIDTFKRDKNFYGNLNMLITVKSFDLKAIRERYLKSKNNKSNRTGSVERRKVTEGGVVNIQLKKGEIINSTILNKLPEPRGIDSLDNIIALSSENIVYVLKENKIYKIQNPWFSYIHTTKINPFDKNKVLISSSGFDCVFEYDYVKGEKTFEWFAWENGFNKGIDPNSKKEIYLTRKIEEADRYKKENKDYLFINKPSEQVLPTSKRAAFINSVSYDQSTPGIIYATFFHEGAVYKINMNTDESEMVLNGLVNPHGGIGFGDKFMATSTKSGEVVIGGLENQLRYNFSEIDGKPELLEDFEWVQNSIFIDDNIISIDSNRNCFVIFNTKKKLIDKVKFDDNWAVQDLININVAAADLELINSIS